MEWAEFCVRLAGQLIWIAIALVSLAFTFWQLWDVYGFQIRAWLAAERKARRADLEWRQWIKTAWNTIPERYPLGS